MFDINGKVAVVTGGANGIGLATVKAILAKGGHPIIADYNEEAGKREAEALGVPFYKIDISDEEKVKEMFDDIIAKNEHLDILVNGAGIGGNSRPITAPDSLELAKRSFNVNVHGTLNCCKYAIAQMQKQGGNCAVVNVASILGVVSNPNSIGYSGSKHAVIGITKSLALENAPQNIRVNVLCPGFTDTAMFNKDLYGEQIYNYILGLQPLSKGTGRAANVDEQAHAIIFMIENSYLTGQSIIVDGGYTVQ